jgi:Flp pilus assembly protein TadG
MLLAMSLVVMIGMLGLGYDMGRMFITKNELQAFVDASALAAITQLDGTRTGVEGANTTALAGPLGATRPNGHEFNTRVISTVTATYSSTLEGTYDSYDVATANDTNTYRFVKVVASAPLQMSFLPVLPGIPTSMTFSANAVAGQQPQMSVTGGLAPFVPDAHNIADTTNFGWVPGRQYTLKWGNKNITTCAGDSGFPAPENAPSAHGFVDLGQGNSTDNLRGVIVYGGYPNASSNPSSVAPGDQLFSASGNRGTSIFSSLAERSDQDSDQTSTTWAQYTTAGTGNFRRVVTVPVGDPASWAESGSTAHVTVIGFANFLLDPASNISGPNQSICATYIGPGNLNGASTGGTDGTKIYTNILYK